MYPLIGESILLAESTEEWSNKRKILAASFYKEKLVKMIKLAKSILIETVEDWNSNFIDKNQPFDMI